MDIGTRMEELRARGLERHLRLVESAQGPWVVVDGREVLLLCSNNYLGLAAHPRVREAAAQAAEEWGAGAGASRLVSGAMGPHRGLERSLAEFKGTDDAVLVGSGYLANVAVVTALAGRGQVVFSDELNHASIIDGCRLARAEVRVYRHADPEHLAWLMAQGPGRPGLIVTDGVFSMDGDLAPLGELAELALRHGCRLVVDEAHGTGCVGPGGRGAVAAAGLSDEVDAIVGTLGKALGSYGAYVAADAELVRYLINVARPIVFSTALPPPAVAAAGAALEILRSEPDRVARVARNARILRESLCSRGLETSRSTTQVLPLVLGRAEDTVRACEAALEAGVFAQAIRPPTVPEGTSRLRLSVMADHDPADLIAAAEVLASVAGHARPAAAEPAVRPAA